MKYEVIEGFSDIQDNSFEYHAGDRFPRGGVNVSQSRLDELASSKNKLGRPLIRKEKEEEPVKPQAKAPEKPKKEKPKKIED